MSFLARRDLLKAGGAGLGAAALFSCGSTRIARTADSSSAKSGKFDSLKPMLDGISPPDERDFQERRERLRRELRSAKAAALLVSGTTSLRYFMGVSWGLSDRFFGALLFEKGEPAFLTPAFEKARALELIPQGTEVRAWDEDEEPMKLVGDILRERGVATNPLAIEIETPFRYVERLQAVNPSIQIVSGFEPARRCRMIKSPKEISLMRRANEITKRAIVECSRHLSEGTTEDEFSGWLVEAHRKLGASSPWVVGLFGPNAAYPHGTKERRKLREGDVVLCDTGGSLHGYQSDVTRTWVFGNPSDRQKKIWDVVKKAQNAARAAANPGNFCEDVDKAARRVVEDAGFGPGYKNFHHRLGHGIGMEGHEEPYMVLGNKLPLQAGMTSSNEPGIYLYGELGVRLEDIQLVTESGAEFLGSESPSLENPFGE